MADVTSSIVGAPISHLICQPFIEVAGAQQELCSVYLDTVMQLAYKDGKGDNEETNVLSFQLERPVTDPDTGTVSVQPFTVNAPLLSLVPVPAFMMEETTVQFTMEVKDVQTTENTKDKSSTANVSGKGFWGVKASISGTVATHSSNTRTTDKSAKYDVFARAAQQPPAEGMSKLNQVFASVIEPIAA